MADKQESEKIELVLGINSFNKPAELSGVDAWTSLVIDLLFAKKGFYPTEPDRGCEIQQYEYSFIDDVKTEIQRNIEDQVATYLPDIPLASVSVTSETTPSGEPIVLIVLGFQFNDGEFDTAVVASKKENGNPLIAVSI